MTHAHQEKASALEVHISFEVSRLASEYLANAYEQIVPMICRTTRNVNPKAKVQSIPRAPNTGGLSK